MNEKQNNESQSAEKEELQAALLAAFGEDALSDVLDDDDDFSEIPAELAAAFGQSTELTDQENGSEITHSTTPDIQLEKVFESLAPLGSDSSKIRWVKQLTQSIYADRFSQTNTAQTSPGSIAKSNQNQKLNSRFVVFAIDDQQYALPISTVKEIAQYPKVTQLPGTPNWLRGVTNLRGQILSVTDLRSLFSLETTAPMIGEKVVVIHQNQTTTAIVVDRLIGLRTNIEPQKDVSKLPTAIARLALGTANIDGQTVVLVDVKKLAECEPMQAFQ